MQVSVSPLRRLVLVGGVVLIAALAAACGVGEPPEVTARSGDSTVSVKPSSYCWSSRLGNTAECADGPLTWNETPLPVHGDEYLAFRFPGQNSVDLVTTMRAVDDAEPAPNARITVPTARQVQSLAPVGSAPLTFAINEPPGMYLVELRVSFPRGDASYGVLIEVLE